MISFSSVPRVKPNFRSAQGNGGQIDEHSQTCQHVYENPYLKSFQGLDLHRARELSDPARKNRYLIRLVRKLAATQLLVVGLTGEQPA